jgi:YidC/Oxa1 family membrane protein insertase
MDSKRFILAAALSLLVIFGVQTLFPPPKPSPKTAADSTAVTQRDSGQLTAGETTTRAPASPAISDLPVIGSADSTPTPQDVTAISAETTVVTIREDSGAAFTMTNIGATPTSVVMNAYKSAAPSLQGQPVNLQVPGQALIKYQIVTNGKTPIDLSKTPFAVTQNDNVLTYQGTAQNQSVTLQYTFHPDGHTAQVTGNVPGVNDGFLVVTLPTTLPATEKDTTQDYNNLGFAYLSKRDGARRVLFSSLDPGEKEPVEGPITWAAAKNKYFVVGVLSPEEGERFVEITLTGGSRTSKIATQATADVIIPIKNGTFAFDLYAGPQEWKRLSALGRNFDEVNPYGWAFMRSILQPIATGVIRLILWMHQQLSLSYGMVLVVLGLLVRIVLWPLNQTAMRTSLRMQEFQPKLQAIQAKYKDNVERQRQEILKLYQEHGMSPFSPFLGCLPMLLPMPVLFALFFVFQNTIEFRGVSFLWVEDLSMYDPYFIWPVLMAISMYLLSWIGMRNAPPNPQAKLMSYIMPVMLLVFLHRMAAGLNVYYAAQNIAALPQQWLIAREQAKRRAQSEGKTQSVAATASKPSKQTKQSKRTS